jgi:hypothetical protein
MQKATFRQRNPTPADVASDNCPPFVSAALLPMSDNTAQTEAIKRAAATNDIIIFIFLMKE